MDLDKDPDAIPKEIVTDEPHGYLEVTEDQLEEAVNTIDQVLSDNPQVDAVIKTAKEAKVKRVLQVETNLAQDPGVLLEMDEETLKRLGKPHTMFLFKVSRKRLLQQMPYLSRYTKQRWNYSTAATFIKAAGEQGTGLLRVVHVCCRKY
jgi:hypothetical protein